VDRTDNAGVFQSVRRALGWWYGPLAARDHWIASWYLAVGVLWSLTMFVAMVAAMSITFGLVVVAAGLLLIVPTFALVDAMTTVERRRAEWVGRSIDARQHRAHSGGWWRAMTTTISDPERWRQAGFVVSFVLVAPVLFTLALTPWVLVIVAVVGVLGNLGAVDLLQVVVALILVGLAPRISIAVARLSTTFVAWFLGPDPTIELAGRVEQLATQRDEILEAVGAERRRIERNLHDGVQQQLVAIGIGIGRAQAKLSSDPASAAELLDAARHTLQATIGELRVIGRGLHPAVLEDRGLDAALSSIVANSPIPVAVDVELDRDLPDDTAATAWYVMSEAVANILKHANARAASVRVVELSSAPRAIRITVHDDGRGGAAPGPGSGLAGIRARVEGIDGSLQIESPPGGPTTLVAVLPVRAVAPAVPEVGAP
jgi:signal transduction histidine kinase